jgi:hypothetical protein
MMTCLIVAQLLSGPAQRPQKHTMLTPPKLAQQIRMQKPFRENCRSLAVIDCTLIYSLGVMRKVMSDHLVKFPPVVICQAGQALRNTPEVVCSLARHQNREPSRQDCCAQACATAVATAVAVGTSAVPQTGCARGAQKLSVTDSRPHTSKPQSRCWEGTKTATSFLHGWETFQGSWCWIW